MIAATFMAGPIGLLRCSLLLLLALNSFPLSASEDKATVLYAGLAYMANCAEIPKALPYLHQAVGTGACDLQPGVDITFGRGIETVTNKKTAFVKQLGQSYAGDALSLVLALDRENVWTTPMRGGFAIAYDVSAQLLTFDFTEKKVVAVFPIHIRYFDFVDEPRSHQGHVAVMQDLVRNPDFPVNLLDEFLALASRIAPAVSYGGYLQVRDVDLTDKAEAYLDEKSFGHDAYRTWIAQVMSQALSRGLEMPVLPYTTGHAIGRKVPARFADGRSFALTLPPADYVVDLRVRGMVKKKLDESRSRVAWSFVFGLGVRALEPLSGVTYLEADFQKARVKTVSHRQGTIDDWRAYGEAAILLADDLARQVATRDASWIRAHAPRGVDVKRVRQGLDTFMQKVVVKVR